MKPLKFTTERRREKEIGFFKGSVNSVFASSPKECPCGKVKGRHDKD